MYIKNLKLKNYRNYDFLDIDLENGVNIIYGDNAQGKTNILEAIYISSTTKTNKNVKDFEIIKFGENEGHIKVILCKEKENIIDIHIKKNQNKGVAVNGVKKKKISEFLGFSNIIFFGPEDLNIIKEGPSIRRKFLDIFICQTNNIYTYNISNYYKILKQRNKLLKDINFCDKQTKKDLLETINVWDIELSKYGNEIIKTRREKIFKLNEKIEKISSFISEGKEKIKIIYEENVLEEDFIKKLSENKEKDIKEKNTSVGPHRDDIKFIINDIDIRKFGSQGQQRTAALSLKLSELNIIKEEINDNPILLLDDVFSELDEKRQKLIIENIKNTQTIITCTGLTENIKNLLKPDKIIKIEKGKIIK